MAADPDAGIRLTDIADDLDELLAGFDEFETRAGAGLVDAKEQCQSQKSVGGGDVSVGGDFVSGEDVHKATMVRLAFGDAGNLPEHIIPTLRKEFLDTYGDERQYEGVPDPATQCDDSFRRPLLEVLADSDVRS
jgi:hypothetical protein